jgi:aspartate aminotransferase
MPSTRYATKGVAMSTTATSRRVAAAGASLAPLIEFTSSSTWARRRGVPGIADLTFGNPHEMPLPGYVAALQQWSTPLNKDWFAYKMSERDAQDVVAESLRRRYGVPFEADDVALTNGGFAALAVGLKLVVDPGDEVIYNLPPWFCYEALILDAGGAPVKVGIDMQTFDLDLEAIAAAITPRTRVVILNTPHNPTGKIYPPGTLERLAMLLDEASARNGRTIYVLSDEPYARIVFDNRQPHSPAAYYPDTLVAYSYGKVLLTPGQRIGYLAVAPGATERQQLRDGLIPAQIAAGWAFPNALLQHAIADLERLSIDIGHLQRKRDRMVQGLRDIGYQVHVPQGTFYLTPRSPIADDARFTELLAEQDVFVLPGRTFEMPGFFRISLTANDEMIERSLSGFADAWAYTHALDLVAALSDDGW